MLPNRRWQESQASSTTLQEQVTTDQAENATLQSDLQQMRAAAVIDSKASSSTTLPWVLLGLLALLTLPLFWLLRRKREQTQVLASASNSTCYTARCATDGFGRRLPLMPPLARRRERLGGRSTGG